MSENPGKPDTQDTSQSDPAATVAEADTSATQAPTDEQPLPQTSHNRDTNPTPVLSALKAETQETLVVAPQPGDYFLMNPANETILDSESRQLPDDGSRWALIVGVPLLLAAIGLIVYAVLRWQAIIPVVRAGSAAAPNTLLNGTLWTAAAFVVTLFALGWYLPTVGRINRRRRLQKRGDIVWGEVVSAVGKPNRADDLIVTVEYTFQRPDRRRRKMLSDQASGPRNDLREKALPSPGNPVAVLYLSPKNYELL